MFLAFDGDPEEVLGLREADDDGGRSGESDEDRVGKEVDQEPEPPDGQEKVDGSDHQRKQRGCTQVAGTPLLDQWCQRRGGEERHDGDRADRQLPGRAEQCVDQDRDGGGVQTNGRWQTGQEGVGHGLGDQHRPDGEPGQEVAAQVASLVAGGPSCDRQTVHSETHESKRISISTNIRTFTSKVNRVLLAPSFDSCFGWPVDCSSMGTKSPT